MLSPVGVGWQARVVTDPGVQAMVVPDDGLGDEAFLTVPPAYGSGSLADVLPSVCALLGVPGESDRLGLSARLGEVERVGVLLVDGLGFHQLALASAYGNVLGDLLVGASSLTSGFPSTTPVSLATLGTGSAPGNHGILGFTVRGPGGRIVNHVHWGDDPDPAVWQPLPTRFATAAAAGLDVTVVSRPEFEGSGLTVSVNRGARYVGASGGAEVAARMIEALTAASGPALVYGYHPDLDKAGHEKGVDSQEWREAAAGVDDLLSRLVDGLPPRSALLVVADHGQLNVPLDSRYDISEIPDLSAGVISVAGEPRVRYLYAAEGARADVIAAWRGVLGESALVLERDAVIAEGWFGPVPPAHLDRIGEIVVMCRKRAVVLASGWEPPAVGRLVAYHGSITSAEMSIPLLTSVA